MCNIDNEAHFSKTEAWQDLIGTDPPYSLEEVKTAVSDRHWQCLRRMLKGYPLEDRHRILSNWLLEEGFTRTARVQVRNYIYALKRGGMIRDV